MAKVLVVDDDKYILDLYHEILEGEGFEVHTAINGEEALDTLHKISYDLVLLDVMMPKVDGMSVLTSMKQNPKLKNVPVVMLTNFGQENVARQAYDLGAADFLIKYKITPGEMTEKVKKMLTPTVPAQL